MALTTAQIQAAYVTFFNRPADVAGLNYWSSYKGSDVDLYNTFAQSAEYTSLFTGQNHTASVVTIYSNLLGHAPDVAGLNYWVAQLDSGALSIGTIANAIKTGAQGTDATIVANKTTAATNFTNALDTEPEIAGYASPSASSLASVKTWLAAVTTDATLATQIAPAALTAITTVVADGIATPGSTFTLTTGSDTFTGTSGNDVFNASTGLAADGTTAIATTNALDKIDGGTGTDTLNIENTQGKNTLTGTITNVENLTFIGAGNVNNNAAVDVSAFSGVVKLQQTDDTGVAVSGVKGQTLSLDRVATGTTLTATLDAAQTSVTLSNAAAVGTAAFSVSGTKLDTVNLTTDKTAGALTVADTGNTTKTANITATGTAAVTVNSTALETVKISGAGAVTLAAGTAPSKALDASGSTGGVTYAVDLVAQQFTGGAGKDVVQFGATTKAQTLGAGDDTATLSVAALGSGGSIDGGEGSDTIALTAANAVTATSDATKGAAFAASISNFEKFGVGATGATATVVDAQYIDGITHVVSGGSTTGTLTINNLAANSTFETIALQGAAVALNLKDSAGITDVLNLKFSAADGFTNTAAITAAGVETLNITTLDTDTTAPTAAFVAPIVAAAVKTVVVSGNVGIDLSGGLAATTLTSFDASGVTATGDVGAVKLTTANLAGDVTIKGGAGNDVLNAALAVTKTVTIDGGAGNDSITGSTAKVNTLNGGDGNDNITGGSAADTINGGAGDDVITGGAGLDTLTGGAGKDTFTVVANTNGNIYATITDAAAGDILNFADAGTETFVKTAVTLGGTAVYQDFLNEAAKGDGSVNGAIAWFQFGGDTYVVEDKSAATSFVNNTDIVVKLTGLVDLTNAVVGDHILTLA